MTLTACAALRGELRFDEPMARHTSWRVGGRADLFFQPADLEDLQSFMRIYPEERISLYWVGLGSNLLVRDGGIRGAVICTAKVLKGVHTCADGSVWSEVGLSCAKLARFCARSGLAGGEFFAGIPGTLGGALAMNAGAWGGETWNLTTEVELINRRGERQRRPRESFAIGYRSVGLPANEWFIAARLRLTPGESALIRERIRRLLGQRNESQPLHLSSAGSVFRNPPGDYAARLIESCGLKGHRIGGAEVSAKHANFILNLGDATARDIEALIRHVHERVLLEHGVDLVTEVRMVGEGS